MGSPLAVFLALRGKNGAIILDSGTHDFYSFKLKLGVRPAGIGKQDHILPKHLCQRLFNIYHPSDPIAYR